MSRGDLGGFCCRTACNDKGSARDGRNELLDLEARTKGRRLGGESTLPFIEQPSPRLDGPERISIQWRRGACDSGEDS
jgi:hypothetical protein